MEKHLEEFLIVNRRQTELGKHFNIYEEDGEIVGQHYPSDTGAIDILALSNDKKTLIVGELKRGKLVMLSYGRFNATWALSKVSWQKPINLLVVPSLRSKMTSEFGEHFPLLKTSSFIPMK